MIGILLITHGAFGKELLKSAEMIMGEIECIKALPLYPEDNLEQLRGVIEEEIKVMDQGEGVLVLVDLFGGSPCNVTASCIRNGNVECITGLSMPMLIKAAEARISESLSEIPAQCIDYIAESAIDVKARYSE